MPKIILVIHFLSMVNGYPGNKVQETGNPNIQLLYLECGLKDILEYDIFEMAVSGQRKISGIKNDKLITIIDYSKPGTSERFYVIDLAGKKILYRTLVAHGKNSGENNPESFSNESGSLKSCTGFFLTNETYEGKNGYSLMLDGLEPGINDNSRMRSVVIHGAAYVSKDFIKKYGRIGRSWGCPALPVNLSREIIDTISKGTCLFIYGDDPVYLRNSKIINGK